MFQAYLAWSLHHLYLPSIDTTLLFQWWSCLAFRDQNLVYIYPTLGRLLPKSMCPENRLVFTSLPFLDSTRNIIYKCERFHYLQSTVYFKSSPYLSSGKLGLSEPFRESDWLESQVFSFELLLQNITLRISEILFLVLERRWLIQVEFFSWVKKVTGETIADVVAKRKTLIQVIASWPQAWNSNSTDISGCREYQQHC